MMLLVIEALAVCPWSGVYDEILQENRALGLEEVWAPKSTRAAWPEMAMPSSATATSPEL